MRFALLIQQNVSRLDVSMQNTMFIRVMHSAGHLCDEADRLPDRKRSMFNYLVKLAAFDKLHTEVAVAIALAHLVDRDDAWMIEARSGFGFKSEALEMCFGRPLAKPNDF